MAITLGTGVAWPATFIWDGGAPGGGSGQSNWTAAGNKNWVGDTAPANDGTAGIVFAGSTRTSPNLDANWSVASLSFASGAAAFSSNSSDGYTLTIGSGGITQNASNTQTITHAITVGANQTWNTASGDLVVSGPVAFGWNTLTKTGSGTLTLSGVNSGQGSLVVSAGTVLANNSNSLGGSNYGNTVASGATLAIQGGITLTEGDITLAGAGVSSGGALRSLSGANTVSSTLTLSAAATIASDADTLTLNGPINTSGNHLTLAGAGNIVTNQNINGSGNLTLSGSGDRTITGSQLNAANIVVSGSGNVTFDTQINASGGSFTQSGNATTTFSGSGNNYFNSVNITDGTVVLAQTGGASIHTNGAVTISGAEVVFQTDNQITEWTNVTLGDGAVFDLGDTDQAIHNLTITGDSIIDFGTGGSTLDVNNLNFDGDYTLTIQNWNSSVDSFLATINPGSGNLPRIVFEGFGEATWSGGTLTPGTPVPEPASFGLLALGSLTAFAAARRRRRPPPSGVTGAGTRAVVVAAA